MLYVHAGWQPINLNYEKLENKIDFEHSRIFTVIIASSRYLNGGLWQIVLKVQIFQNILLSSRDFLRMKKYLKIHEKDIFILFRPFLPAGVFIFRRFVFLWRNQM